MSLTTELLVAILPAMITGGITLVGVFISNSRAQAVTDTKLDELTREVREHNGFARRVPVLEEKMDAANSRIAALERWQYDEQHRQA